MNILKITTKQYYEKKKEVCIIGTHGIPAKYGGFETLADYLCQNLSDEFNFTVFSYSGLYPNKPKEYLGVKLKYINIYPSGFTGIFYDLYAYIIALFTSEIILYLSPVGSGFITPLKYFFKGRKIIVNHGGLNEWEREKLTWIQRKWAKFNHYVAATTSSINIVDNNLYKQSLKNAFGVESVVIRYGGDHARKPNNLNGFLSKYPYLNEKYAISVSRAQIDNNLHIVLEAFEKFNEYKLVLVANWDISDYGKKLFEKYKNHPNIITQKAVYDIAELNALRNSSYCYIHSHSRCGTAPSLVEAMCLELPIISFDVPTNRETTQNKALYFNNATTLIERLLSLDDEYRSCLSKEMKDISKNFTWRKISDQYKEVINSLDV